MCSGYFGVRDKWVVKKLIHSLVTICAVYCFLYCYRSVAKYLSGLSVKGPKITYV
jgi:hypothetical protein